jgi:phosphomannomutase
MNEASETGAGTVVGYEANGGFLINSDVTLYGKTLTALPTRDAVILLLSIVLLAEKEGKKISQLAAGLPGRFTASDRLKDFPQADSRSILEMFDTGDEGADKAKGREVFGELCGGCVGIDRMDGVRMTFENDEIVHLRPSGNAPEFRCYNEASEAGRAVELNARCMEILKALRESAR